MPNQDNQSNNPVSTISPQSDLPPMPPAFQDLSTQPQPSTAGTPEEKNSPSASTPPVISSIPRKKYGGGRIIATLLGILLLVVGVGAGLILTQQQQLFQQQAASNCCKQGSTKSCTIGGQSGTATCVATDPSDCVGQAWTGRWGSCKVNNPPPGGCTPNCTGKTCGSGKDGCNHTCENGSGCNYCKPATTSFCSTYGGCEPDSNGGHCTYGPGQSPPPGEATCGSGLECSGSPISGAVKCTQDNPQRSTAYCCPSGKHIDTNAQGVKQCAAANICGGNVCAFPKTCQNNQCVYVDNASCGRNIDTNAPVCCDTATKNNCTNKVCEKPNRLECVVGGVYCTIDANGCTPGKSPGPNPTPNPAASCQALKAYNNSWVALTTTQLSSLKSGSQVNLCVTGATTSGSFDKAQLTINGTQQAETTTKGQGAAAAAFCQKYTIPAAVTTFNVTAQMHHKTLGWVQ